MRRCSAKASESNDVCLIRPAQGEMSFDDVATGATVYLPAFLMDWAAEMTGGMNSARSASKAAKRVKRH